MVSVATGLFFEALQLGVGIMRTKLVSLTDELAALEDVIESAQLLAELIQNEHLPDMDSRSRAPGLLAAVLGLALGRVKLLRQVVLKQADSGLLVGRHKYRDRVLRSEDPDVLLGSAQREKTKR